MHFNFTLYWFFKILFYQSLQSIDLNTTKVDHSCFAEFYFRSLALLNSSVTENYPQSPILALNQFRELNGDIRYTNNNTIYSYKKHKCLKNKYAHSYMPSRSLSNCDISKSDSTSNSRYILCNHTDGECYGNEERNSA